MSNLVDEIKEEEDEEDNLEEEKIAAPYRR
jgi:hypothetical protein